MIPAEILARRAAHLRQSSILRSLTLKVNSLPDGINLGQGVCDLPMPEPLRAGAIQSLLHDKATYTSFSGLDELRRQISSRMLRRYALEYDPDGIVVTIGSSLAFTSTLLTLTDPGDEVVLFEPFYPYHKAAAQLAGANVRFVGTDPMSGEVAWDMLSKVLSPRTRIVVVNTPGNPSGKVWRQDELHRLAAALKGTSAYLVTDEIYEDLVYDGRKHVPPASIPELWPRTITISGLSKSFSVTGWRLGWLAAPPAISHAIGPVFDVMAVCAARPLQAAAAVALHEVPEAYYEDLKLGYQRRRQILCEALKSAGFDVCVPAGAYYVLANYARLWGNVAAYDACLRLLEQTRIAAIPSDIFYSGTAPAALRFHFAVEDSMLNDVAQRLSGLSQGAA